VGASLYNKKMAEGRGQRAPEERIFAFSFLCLLCHTSTSLMPKTAAFVAPPPAYKWRVKTIMEFSTQKCSLARNAKQELACRHVLAITSSSP
jgi:hypothetical protein